MEHRRRICDAEKLLSEGNQMKVGDLVKHKLIDSLGIGFVISLQGAHTMVRWSHSHSGSGHAGEQPTLEVVNKLEVISESR
jgi:hypothetical protein